MDVSWEGGESGDLSSTSNDGTGRRPTLRFSIEDREAHATEIEERQNENTQGRHRHSSVFDDEFEGENHVRKSRSRKSSSNYAAATKASRAKKNEKVEIPIYSGSAIQRAFSTLSSMQASPIQHSPSMFKNSQDASPISDYLPQSPWEQNHKALQTKTCNLSPIDSRTVGSHNDEYVADILHDWEQQKQEAEGWPGTDENSCFEEEELRKRLEDLETEQDKALDIRGQLQRELAIAKDEIVNLQRHNSELDDRIRENDLASTEGDERAQIELRVYDRSAMDWKQKHDELCTRTKELEKKIEARNRLEHELLSMEAVEADNRRLLATVAEREKELRKIQKELDQISEYAQEIDNEALDSDRRLGALQKFMSDMSEVVTKWAQASSREQRVEPSDMDSLIKSYADDAEAKKLLVNTRQLLGNFVQKHDILESRMEDKKYEIENVKKGMRERIEEFQEAVSQSPGVVTSAISTPVFPLPGLPASALPTLTLPTPVPVTPGLMRPPISLQNDREGFESLYEEELEKRKAAEKRIHDISGANKQQLRLQQAKKQLELHLKKVLEENEVLRRKAEEAKLQADLWKDESKQNKLELDKRSTEFQSCIDQKEKEKDQYIRYYHVEIQDKSRWEAASLHKELEDQEQMYKRLEQDFDRKKAANARKEHEIASLERKCMIQSKYTRDVEQAILYNEEIPTLPNLDGEDVSQYGSEPNIISPTSTLTPSIHSEGTGDRRLKPRFTHPNAILARMAEVDAYRALLEAKSDEELLDDIFKAPVTTVRKGKAADDIIEKVRKWRFGENYPPEMEDWVDIRSKSLWERWEGENWAAQCKEKRFLEMLRRRQVSGDP